MNAAFANFSKGLADRGKHDGVNVNVIHPGLTETERFFEQAKRRAKAANITPEEAQRRTESTIPVGRIGTPEEFGAVAAFLCSDSARFITGAAIPVDGGADAALM